VKFAAAASSERRGSSQASRISGKTCLHLIRKPTRLLSLGLLFLFGAGSASAVDPSKLLSQYGHTAWRIQDGYFSGQLTSLAQTVDGYLWIGTVNGLFRFDGVRFPPWNRLAGQQVPTGSTNCVSGNSSDSSIRRWKYVSTNARALRENYMTRFCRVSTDSSCVSKPFPTNLTRASRSRNSTTPSTEPRQERRPLGPCLDSDRPPGPRPRRGCEESRARLSVGL